MLHVRGIESELDGFESAGVEIEKSGHDDITEESGKKDGDESPELQARIV